MCSLSLERAGGDDLRPTIRAKRATTVRRQARAGENVRSTTGLGLVACRWHSACEGSGLIRWWGKSLLYLRRQLLYGPASMNGQLFPSHCHETTLFSSLISSTRMQAQFDTPPPLTVVVPE